MVLVLTSWNWKRPCVVLPRGSSSPALFIKNSSYNVISPEESGSTLAWFTTAGAKGLAAGLTGCSSVFDDIGREWICPSLPEFHIHKDVTYTKYIMITVQPWLPAAALEANLNLGGIPWAQRGGAEQRAETSFGSCISFSLLFCSFHPQ